MAPRAPALALAAAGGAAASGNAVGRVPVMGWSGYLAFMQNSGHCDKAGAGGYNETTFLGTMDALVSTGLRDLGYVYLNADDCWIAENRTADGQLTHDETRFPHGMAWLADQAHAKQLRLGLYAAASVETCRNFPGSQANEERDAATFAAWGADFVKLDSCGGVLASGAESWEQQYGRWSRALNASGRQMVFSCSWAVYFTLCAAKYPPSEWESRCGALPWRDGLIGELCHMWRYGDDLVPQWGTADGARDMNGGGGPGVGDVIQFASSFWASAWRGDQGPGAFPDPDFLAVGCPVDKPCEGFSGKKGTPLSALEQRTQMSMWCLLAAPLIIGSDVRDLTPAALATLSNRAAIAINQDPLAAAPRLVSRGQPRGEGAQVWARALAGGDVAVALVNMHPNATRRLEVTFADVLCAACRPRAHVVDVWGDAAGAAHDAAYAADVPPHGAALLRLTPL